MEDMRADPQDEDTQAALRRQLKKALDADPAFMAELSHLLEGLQPAISARIAASPWEETRRT